MSEKSRQELLMRLRYDYKQSCGKKARSALLDQWCRVSGHERKYAIKEMRGQRGPGIGRAPKRRGGRAKRYGAAELGVVKGLWQLSEQPCGKRLKAVIALWLESWERAHGALEAGVRERVVQISASQLDRMLAPFKIKGSRRPGPGSDVRRQVPVRPGPWQAQGCGWVGVDTVAHCGGNMGGCFVWSVCMTDLYSGWTEVRARWNRSDRVVHGALCECRTGLPFTMKGYHSDNGGEVLNGSVIRWLAGMDPPVEQTRSRAYRKNDNAHVEQKNLTHIRLLAGWERFGHAELAPVLDALEAKWSLWNNLYSPTLKLLSRERVGAHVVRRWEKQAHTPAQRVLAALPVEDPGRQRIERLLARHDPVTLKAEIERELRAFFTLLRRLDANAA